MVDFIERFAKVKIYDIDTPVLLKAGKYIFKIRQELAEAGSSPSKGRYSCKMAGLFRTSCSI